MFSLDLNPAYTITRCRVLTPKQTMNNTILILWQSLGILFVLITRKYKQDLGNGRISINTHENIFTTTIWKYKKYSVKKYTIYVNILNIIIKCVVDLSLSRFIARLSCTRPRYFKSDVT